jgi:thiamine biosynthesis lipoprotein
MVVAAVEQGLGIGEEVSVSPTLTLTREAVGYRLAFHAMACPCEVRIEVVNQGIAEAVGRAAEAEARRIEAKYSRYRPDSVLAEINGSAGWDISIDVETAKLIDFAAQCFETSGGRFDITSGVLRRIWHFDGSDNVPTDQQVRSLKPLIGWKKVTWRPPRLCLRTGMEIDFGGLGKEYAVDRALAQTRRITQAPVLVNFGGDLRVSGPRLDGARWKIAIETPEQPGMPAGMLEIAEGALATSGDARRFLLKDGVRYGHILNPLTGRPVVDAPRSVTVAAATCIEAGMLATLAVLNGRQAEKFLKREGVRSWCIR